MTDIPTPEAVEAMTHRFDRLLDRAMQAQVLHHTWINVRVDDLTALLVARLDAAEARSLPLPRRYTGGPLEDGLYLWRRDRWRPTAWRMALIEDGEPERLHSSLPDPGDWIIGPVPLPIIPGEEAAP